MAKKVKNDDETRGETSDGSIAANDAWTGLLAISLLALAVGSGFLLYDYLQYPDNVPTLPLISSKPAQPGGPPPAKGDGGEKKVDEKDKGKEKKDASLQKPATYARGRDYAIVSKSHQHLRFS